MQGFRASESVVGRGVSVSVCLKEERQRRNAKCHFAREEVNENVSRNAISLNNLLRNVLRNVIFVHLSLTFLY